MRKMGYKVCLGLGCKRELFRSAVLFLAAAPLAGQGFFTNAQRAGMGGVSLRVDASLSRYNVAYRAVPPRTIQGGAKASDRKSVVSGKSADLGGRRIINKKKRRS